MNIEKVHAKLASDPDVENADLQGPGERNFIRSKDWPTIVFLPLWVCSSAG